jgi:hypothetical protein
MPNFLPAGKQGLGIVFYKPSNKSFHCGFIFEINSSFHALFHFFNTFSLAIASSIRA